MSQLNPKYRQRQLKNQYPDNPPDVVERLVNEAMLAEWPLQTAQKFCARKSRAAIRQLGGFEEVYQVAQMAVWEAAKRYRPERASFKTFQYVAVWGYLLRWYYEATKYTPWMPSIETCFSAVRGLQGFGEDSVQLNIRDHRERELPAAALDLPDAMRRLTEREREMVHLYFWGGLSFRAIGDRWGCTYQRVCQVWKMTLAKLRDHFDRGTRSADLVSTIAAMRRVADARRNAAKRAASIVEAA